MSIFERRVVGAVCVLAAAGCVVVPRGDEAGKKLWGVPKAETLLPEAERAAKEKRYEDALALARKAIDETQRDNGTSRTPFVTSEERGAALMAGRYWVGVSLRHLGREIDLLLELRDNKFVPEICGASYRDRCAAHTEWLMATYPNVLAYNPKDVLAAVRFVDTGDVTPLQSPSRDLMEPTEARWRFFEPYDRTAKKRTGWVAVKIRASVKKDVDKDTVALRVEGRTSTLTDETCAKVGEARIGGSKFDVERCHTSTTSSPPANFVVHVPRADAARVTIPSGDRTRSDYALVYFDVSSLRRSGDTWTATKARVIDAFEGR
jgi:hypothetical protein